jgi:endonuclease III
VTAPKSPYGLIQEEFQKDPWKVFVVCIFCNLTRRTESEPYMREFFARWPSAADAAIADQTEINDLIKTLGLADRRAKTLTRMSQDYLVKSWQAVLAYFTVSENTLMRHTRSFVYIFGTRFLNPRMTH